MAVLTQYLILLIRWLGFIQFRILSLRTFHWKVNEGTALCHHCYIIIGITVSIVFTFKCTSFIDNAIVIFCYFLYRHDNHYSIKNR